MHNRGLTLPELLTSLAIVGVLLTCAAPLNSKLHRHRLQTDATQLASSLRYARTQAVLMGSGITVLAINGNWSKGWKVFVDNNRNAQLDATERLLTAQQPGAHCSYRQPPVAKYIHFAMTGEPAQTGGGFQAGTLRLCSPDTPDIQYKIVLAKAGRLRLRDDYR